MSEAIRDRVLYSAKIMVNDRLTVRDVAKIVGVSKSTVHKDLTEKLKTIDELLFDEITSLLDYNKKIRHIRGGQKTKEKYEKLKTNCKQHQ